MLQLYWQAIRPNTLVASLGPILLATALASQATTVNPIVFACTLLCALSLQISVNLANDYFDGQTGIDNENRLGPVRMTQSGLLSPQVVKRLMLVFTLVAVISGLYLVYLGGYSYILFGLLCLLGVYSYSAGPYPLASHGLGEIAVFIFFGLIAVIGSYYLQAQAINLALVLYGGIVGFYSAAIMLVNNIRDINTDASANKHTLAVKLGTRNSQRLYQGLLVTTLALHSFNALSQTIELKSKLLLLLMPLVCCLPITIKLCREINLTSGRAYNQLLIKTAKLGFIYSLTVSASVLISKFT